VLAVVLSIGTLRLPHHVPHYPIMPEAAACTG
jgi:hypothetical protein